MDNMTHPLMQPLVHGDFSGCALLDAQQLHQGLDGDTLRWITTLVRQQSQENRKYGFIHKKEDNKWL